MAQGRRGARRHRKLGKKKPSLAEQIAKDRTVDRERPWEKDFSGAPIFLMYGPSPTMRGVARWSGTRYSRRQKKAPVGD